MIHDELDPIFRLSPATSTSRVPMQNGIPDFLGDPGSVLSLAPPKTLKLITGRGGLDSPTGSSEFSNPARPFDGAGRGDDVLAGNELAYLRLEEAEDSLFGAHSCPRVPCAGSPLG